MIHVRNEADGLAVTGLVLVNRVEIPEFIAPRADVRQPGQPFFEAGPDMLFVARCGGTGRDCHSRLIEFFIENVHWR